MAVKTIEVKQVVGKRRNKKRYLYSLPVSLSGGVAMVFTLFGLNMRRPSRDGCHGKLSFFLYPSALRKKERLFFSKKKMELTALPDLQEQHLTNVPKKDRIRATRLGYRPCICSGQSRGLSLDHATPLYTVSVYICRSFPFRPKMCGRRVFK